MTPEQVSSQLSLLRPGAVVTIEISTPAGQKVKARSHYVGFLPKQYVLIQMPDTSKLGNAGQYIKQDAACTVRGLVEGEQGAVIAFICSIERTLQLPSKLIVLSFPQSIALQPLRKNTRISTTLTGAIVTNGESWKGTIKDLSVSGCLVSIANATELLLTENQDVELIVKDSTIDANTKFTGAVSNIKQRGGEASIGIRFTGDNKEPVVELIEKILLSESQ